MGLLELGLVDVLHQDTLVLEHVTLHLDVQLVVQVLVDLLGLAVLLKHATEHTQAAHPQNLLRHTGVTGTAALAVAGVSTLALGFKAAGHTGAGVDLARLLDDETILDQHSGCSGGSWPWRSRSPRSGP